MTTVSETPSVVIEDVESFRHRARSWIRSNLSPAVPEVEGATTPEQELAEVARFRRIQQMLFDAGFAGIVVPKQYGGAGLTPAHARAFLEEIVDYDYPSTGGGPGLPICLPVILEFGTEEQKLSHVPAMLKGEEIFVQFLSEPGGGSDVAGAQTTAVRDGDDWILNGSKIWSSGAWRADWGLCLARTNWDVEKHRGLTVFMVPIHSPGIEVRRIEMASGTGPGHFCQEFFTDVRIPDANRIGGVDDGWTVGVRWMFYERTYVVGPFATRLNTSGGQANSATPGKLVRYAQQSERMSNPLVRNMLGEICSNALVAPESIKRIYQGMRTGYLTDQAAALMRLQRGVNATRLATTAFELAGNAAIAWVAQDDDLGELGFDFITRQAAHIGGGSIEMARNVISERVLGMPRERSGDRDVPYREVPKGPPSK